MKCCENCVAPKRHLGCHSKCEEYLVEKAQNQEKKDKIRQEKEKQNIVSSFQVEATLKRKAHYNSHKKK